MIKFGYSNKCTILIMITLLLSLNDAFSFQKTMSSRSINSKKSQPSFTKSAKVTAKRSALFQSSKGVDKSSSDAGSASTSISIRERLSKISNIASMLCVIDCTVLPIVTVLLPLIGLGASPAQAKWLHELGHSVAIFFVLPVGGLAATMNYLSSKNAFLSSIAALGLSMIYAANGHGGPILDRLPHDLAHSLHCGTLLHRAVNIIGCACLLTSNYFAHRLSCDHDHHSCDHGHSHDHKH